MARPVDGLRELKTHQVEIPPIPPFVAYPPGLAGPSRFGLSSGSLAPTIQGCAGVAGRRAEAPRSPPGSRRARREGF